MVEDSFNIVVLHGNAKTCAHATPIEAKPLSFLLAYLYTCLLSAASPYSSQVGLFVSGLSFVFQGIL